LRSEAAGPAAWQLGLTQRTRSRRKAAGRARCIRIEPPNALKPSGCSGRTGSRAFTLAGPWPPVLGHTESGIRPAGVWTDIQPASGWRARTAIFASGDCGLQSRTAPAGPLRAGCGRAGPAAQPCWRPICAASLSPCWHAYLDARLAAQRRGLRLLSGRRPLGNYGRQGRFNRRAVAFMGAPGPWLRAAGCGAGKHSPRSALSKDMLRRAWRQWARPASRLYAHCPARAVRPNCRPGALLAVPWRRLARPSGPEAHVRRDPNRTKTAEARYPCAACKPDGSRLLQSLRWPSPSRWTIIPG